MELIRSIPVTLDSLSIPKTIRIENTKLCNETCTFCPYTMEEGKGKHMSEEIYHLALSQHRELGGDKILFPSTLGEPLLSRHFEDWVKIASTQYGYSEIHTFSNATVLHPERANRLMDNGLTGIMFTLHGLTQEYFQEITGFKYYDRVVDNIRYFAQENARRKHPVKVFLTIYSPHHKAFVEEHSLVRELKDLGVILTIHDMSELHNWGGDIQVNESKLHAEHQIPCKRLWSQIGIAYNGDIVMCCCDYSGSVKLGNINESSLQDIFFLGEHKKIRDLHQLGESSKIKVCSECTTRDTKW